MTIFWQFFDKFLCFQNNLRIKNLHLWVCPEKHPFFNCEFWVLKKISEGPDLSEFFKEGQNCIMVASDVKKSIVK